MSIQKILDAEKAVQDAKQSLHQAVKEIYAVSKPCTVHGVQGAIECTISEVLFPDIVIVKVNKSGKSMSRNYRTVTL